MQARTTGTKKRTLSHVADTFEGIVDAVVSTTFRISAPRFKPPSNPAMIAVENEVPVNADKTINHQK